MDTLFKQLLDQLIPCRCVLCRQRSRLGSLLCLYCYTDLQFFDYQLFDNLLLQPDIKQGINRPRFDTLISLAPYQWPFSQWISDLKFKEAFQLADMMATQLAALLKYLLNSNPELLPEVILPMPVHKHRQFERGYNQAQLLASAVAKTLFLPVDNHILRRKKSTKAQSSLNKKARKSNVNDAFICTPNNYQHIALIDDVITTGSTVNEACKILRSRGCKQISVWTICATPKHRKKGRKIS